MPHPDDDTLLKAVLGLLDPDEQARWQAHLDSCEACRNRYGRITEETGVLRRFDPEINVTAPALPRARSVGLKPLLLKAAAVLVVGLGISYLAASWIQPQPVTVVAQRLVTQTPPYSDTSFAACDQVDTQCALR